MNGGWDIAEFARPLMCSRLMLGVMVGVQSRDRRRLAEDGRAVAAGQARPLTSIAKGASHGRGGRVKVGAGSPKPRCR
jgi:hypothetical protein